MQGIFYNLDNAYHFQLLAEAAAANSIAKAVISDKVAQFNANAIQSAVSQEWDCDNTMGINGTPWDTSTTSSNQSSTRL